MKWSVRHLYVAAVCIASVLCLPSMAVNGQSIPRPEYPNPQMVRSEWMNLNGEWEFAETDDSSKQFLDDQPYPDKIIVPFCRESILSGLGRLGFVNNVWYRRSFELDTHWHSPRIRLHIGACDWETSIWLNGKYVVSHTGGSAPLIFDITGFLKSGENTIIIHAFDDTRSGLQETGKQVHGEKSGGCFYTRVTGIWQTVWLEGVGSSYIRNYKIDCDPASSRVFITPDVDVSEQGLTIRAVAYAGKKVVGTAQAPIDWRNTRLELKLSQKHLWSIENPFLYDMKLTILKNGKTIDELQSYFGLRTVSIKGTAILINGKPVFQRLVLDQGYYPDGIWTTPSAAALKHDIEISQAVGFNGARLHQKVFDPIYLYWADKMGYIVWGEAPNWGMATGNSLVYLPVINEWMEILKRDMNHPAIIGWCPFNETSDDAIPLQNSVANLTRMIDPSRPVIDSSGWTHGLADPDVMDDHDYEQNPAVLRQKWCDKLAANAGMPVRYGGSTIPFFISEFGGIGWNTNNGWGYGDQPTDIEKFYERYAGLTKALLDSRDSFGFCYTQLYDVEQEQNGLYTYDRQPKFDIKRLHDIISRTAACETAQVSDTTLATRWQVLVGAFPDKEAREWKYTVETPASEWATSTFDDSKWRHGMAGFGKKAGLESFTSTLWDTSNIWMRQQFDYDGSSFSKLLLILNYDDGCQVYLNGTLIQRNDDWTNRYAAFDITKAGGAALKQGQNVIAIHCEQKGGGQFIDAALLAGKN